MSLAIDVDIIEKVLLSDGWHEVADASFQVDTYEYVHEDWRCCRRAKCRG
jgi:hypothetical protein